MTRARSNKCGIEAVSAVVTHHKIASKVLINILAKPDINFGAMPVLSVLKKKGSAFNRRLL